MGLNRKRTTLCGLALGLISLLSHENALAADYEVVEADVRYYADHPMHAVEGISNSASGTIEYALSQPLDFSGLKGKFVQVPWVGFSSGNKSRDANVLDTVGAARYPLLTFVAEDFTDLTQSGDRIDGIMAGRIYANGAKVSVRTPFKATMVEEGLELETEFQLKMTEFGMTIPTLLFVKAADEVRIRAHVKFRQIAEKDFDQAPAPQADRP